MNKEKLNELANSSDYKDRFKAEVYQLQDKRDKLSKLIEDNDYNRLDFELSCPVELLKEQEYYMYRYLDILYQRAAIEKVQLDRSEVMLIVDQFVK